MILSTKLLFARWVTSDVVKVASTISQSKTLLSHSNGKPIYVKKSLLHCSARQHGLEEFFGNPKNFGNYKLKSGAAWSKDLLRRKSLEDLQKLWPRKLWRKKYYTNDFCCFLFMVLARYVLLKERNMLQTLELHCSNVDEAMPGPDRPEKVAESMSNLRDVIMERDRAQNYLIYGRTTKHGGEWRKNPLGSTYWYEYKEHLIPKELQEVQKGDRPAEMAYFNTTLEEWHLRRVEKTIKARRMYDNVVRRKWQLLRKSNPHLPVRTPMWWKKKFQCKFKYGIHPEARVLMPYYDDRLYLGGRPKHKY